MKCPQCMGNQKYKEGMICGSCGYRFALNPKEWPNITDMGMRNAIRDLSGPEEYYFTWNQLVARLYRVVKKKKRAARIALTIFLFVVVLVLTIIFLGKHVWPIAVVIVAAVLTVVKIAKSPVNISYGDVTKVIESYRTVHPIEHLVDGRMFSNLTSEDFDPELMKYAPERIIIVERDDLTDMLLMNRFHFDNKALILSAGKYPGRAFSACRQYLEKFPDIPVILMHDASESGLRMKARLLKDESWHLDGKNLQDVGLFPQDLDSLKTPLWLPDAENRIRKGSKILSGGPPIENIKNGYIMPVDMAPPRGLMNAMPIAIVGGLALLSGPFLAEQAKTETGTGFVDGFG